MAGEGAHSRSQRPLQEPAAKGHSLATSLSGSTCPGQTSSQRRALKAAAIHHAIGIPPIDSSVLRKILRRLPNKAAGPDGITYDFLTHLPYPAVNRLAQLLTEMENTDTMPTQMLLTNIVMIPNNSRVERPIALTSCLYRVWNRYRKYDLHRWQLSLGEESRGTRRDRNKIAFPLPLGGCSKLKCPNIRVSTLSHAWLICPASMSR